MRPATWKQAEKVLIKEKMPEFRTKLSLKKIEMMEENEKSKSFKSLCLWGLKISFDLLPVRRLISLQKSLIICLKTELLPCLASSNRSKSDFRTIHYLDMKDFTCIYATVEELGSLCLKKQQQQTKSTIFSSEN